MHEFNRLIPNAELLKGDQGKKNSLDRENNQESTVGKRTIIDLPRPGLSMTPTSIGEILTGRTQRKKSGNWIEVKEVESGVYRIVDDGMTHKEGNPIINMTALGFSSWDHEVTDLDAGNSPESQLFGLSTHLVWQDVEFGPFDIKAPSIERLKEALDHVTVSAWCPGDI